MAGTRNKAKLDEVRDEQGRRRFHGAFTGGFSAGFYNSVGSKEGWQPREWQSSRGSRGGGGGGGSGAGAAVQRPEDFMDEEDGLLGRELEAQLPYDTLGEQARRLVREQAGRQAKGAAIPGIEAVDELMGTCGGGPLGVVGVVPLDCHTYVTTTTTTTTTKPNHINNAHYTHSADGRGHREEAAAAHGVEGGDGRGIAPDAEAAAGARGGAGGGGRGG
jgi:hypothetical protein